MIDQEEFINERLKDEVISLVNAKFQRISIGIISQNIETLGAFLDKKPFKTPRQSSIRFNLALEKLFPSRYSFLNRNGFLYKQLRSNFTHLNLDSRFLDFDFSENSNKHLKYIDGKTTIHLESFLADYIAACDKLIEFKNSGKVKEKNLA